MNGAAISLIALSWLWPFGGDGASDEETIGSLEEQQVEVEPAGPIPGSNRLARENYRRFLERFPELEIQFGGDTEEAPRMVPGSAREGIVKPIRRRTAEIAWTPSSTIATMGPEET